MRIKLKGLHWTLAKLADGTHENLLVCVQERPAHPG